MGGQQRIYKQRIASTTTLAKVFRAMEMIAASRIGAARRAATEAGPYEKALTQAVAAVAVHTDLDHPLTEEREDTNRVAILVVASDRGMAGAYSTVWATPAEGGVGSTLDPAELSLEVEHVSPRSTLTIEPLSVTILLSDVAFQPES